VSREARDQDCSNLPGATDRIRHETEIEEWLLVHLRTSIGPDCGEIHPDMPLAGLTVESSAAVNLTIDLIKWLQVDVPITLLWEYPTVRSLAGALAELCRQNGHTRTNGSSSQEAS
jgi:acyl carrier protein